MSKNVRQRRFEELRSDFDAHLDSVIAENEKLRDENERLRSFTDGIRELVKKLEVPPSFQGGS